MTADERSLERLVPDGLAGNEQTAPPGAALRRIAATLRFGFGNRYLSIAWHRSS